MSSPDNKTALNEIITDQFKEAMSLPDVSAIATCIIAEKGDHIVAVTGHHATPMLHLIRAMVAMTLYIEKNNLLHIPDEQLADLKSLLLDIFAEQRDKLPQYRKQSAPGLGTVH